MKMYRAEHGNYGAPRITKVEVEKETNASVFIKGTRHAKRASGAQYFHTFDEAKQYLVVVYTQRYKSAQSSLKIAESHLGNAKGMQEPE